MKNITFCMLMFYGIVSHAQLIVTNTVETPAQLVQNVLVDASVNPTNITFNGTAANANVIRDQASHFTTNFNPTNLGLNEGLLLSSGKGQVALGPNDSGNLSMPTSNPVPGDPDLAILAAGNTVQNAAVLEFDFVATGLELNFDYVFASEEYPEYSNSAFNDAFGFFLRGPGIAGPFTGGAKNIALIPSTTIPITINNVNNGTANAGPCDNCAFYVANGTGTTPAANPHIQYDGFTTVLRATSALICGETYHIKLAVANVSDNAWDSAVFLKNFKIKPLELVDNLNLSENLDVCYGEVVTIDSGLTLGTNVFVWSVNTTYDPANPGTYDPTAFTVIPGETGTTLTVTQNGVYSLAVYTDYGCQIAYDEIKIVYRPEIPIDAPDPINICTLNPFPLSVNIDQTSHMMTPVNPADYMVTYYNTTYDNAHDGVPTGVIPNGDLATYPITTATTTIWVRIEEVFGSGCVLVKPFTINVSPEPSGNFSYPGSPFCAALALQPITSNVTPGGTYTATPAGLNIDPVTGQIDPSASTPGSYLVDYVLAASGSCPEFRVDDIPVSVTATPAAPAAVSPLTYCQDETAPVLSATGTSLLWYTTATGGTGSVTAPTPVTTLPGSTTYYVSQTNGCEGPRAPIVVNVTATPAAPTFTAVAPYCQNVPASALTAIGSGLLWYSAATGGVGSASAPVPSTTTAGTTNYYVSQTVSGCESPRVAIPVETIALPSAPTVTPSLGYCEGAAAPALSATGTGLLWYAAATGGVGNAAAPMPSTAGVGSTNYYVSQTVNGCEGPRAVITVDIFAIPNAPTLAVTQPTCAVNTGTITISAPLGINLEYSINNGVNFQTNPVFAAVASGATYDVVVRNSLSGCVSSVAQAIVNPALVIPAAPTASTTVQPNCITPTGTIEITAPLGANLEYTITGGTTYQSGTTFAGLAPNAAYTLSVRDTGTGCVSTDTVVNVSPIPANPAAPTVAVTQPICTTPTGTVAISAPTGANLEYSIDGGINYQASTIFAGLAPNANYNLTVRDNVTGCVSSITVAAVDPIPANPAVPVVTIVHPTCGVTTGSFTINTPIGGNLQYSIDGGITYQNSVSFNALAAGATYNPIVKDILTGCVSAPGNVVINPVLNVPAAPTMSVTLQPICTTPTGTIVVTAPTGANLTYSIDGGATYQPGTTFAGLPPNATYSIIVKDNTSGCVSTATTATVNPLPANPPAPTASATVQPICTAPTGTIEITAPTGVDFEYSINGGTTYQSGTTFASLAPNATYNLTVRNMVTGCVSAPTAIVINPIPTNPAAPTGTTVQPTCIAPTGSIAINNPIGANLEYSIDGGTTYQSGTDFTALVPNATYNILVRNTVTGCVSAPGAFVITPAPTFPATPVASGSNVCAEGTISLSTPAVASATYSWTGPNGFTSSDQNPSISNADASMAGTYSVVISTTANCPSLPGSVTIVVNPLPLPTLPQDGNICYNAVTNTVLNPYTLYTGMSDADYDFAWYAESGGTYNVIAGENLSSYQVNTPGNYGVVVTNVATGCVSHMVTAPVSMTSPPLTLDVVTSEYFADNQTIAINTSPAGNYEYQLDNGAWQSSNVFNNVISGTHVVRVRNACGGIESEAYLMDYPKFFTPNGDGYNDTWNIFELKDQANAKIYIFDRYGKLLKEISPSGKGWDGTFNQNILPSSDYWFSVHYKENDVEKVFKSHFALKR